MPNALLTQLNLSEGMLTSWNKFCFNTGYIEMSISMPGSPKAPGLWPGRYYFLLSLQYLTLVSVPQVLGLWEIW